MAKGLTPTQRRALQAIVSATRRDGFPPTIKELTEALGLGSTYATVCHLNALEKKGFISRRLRTARGLTVLRLPNHSDSSGDCAPEARTNETQRRLR